MDKKLRRSARLVDMTQHLLDHPYRLIPLTTFAEQFGSAKSSISEDLSIIKELFEEKGIGLLKTMAGAAGGVKFIPFVKKDRAVHSMQQICRRLQQSQRLLPGGYLYMSDILGEPEALSQIGKVMASMFAERPVDYIMTVETKGIPLAYATALYLNVPVLIVRRDNKVTEGSAVSINYVSGSSKRIQTMSLARRVLPEASRVIIVDDFMKAGGTVRGMVDLLKEFRAEVVGICVFVETDDVDERLVDNYISIAKLTPIDRKDKEIQITLGNFIEQYKVERNG
jgi:purine operon repressor